MKKEQDQLISREEFFEAKVKCEKDECVSAGDFQEDFDEKVDFV